MNETHKPRPVRNKTRQRAVHMRKVMREEIDAIRTKVRAAYTLEAQINVCSYKATEEELEIISERTFNTKLLEKLEAIYFNTNKSATDTQTQFDSHLYRDNLIILNFFYLVRLAQQGFLYLISGAYPDLEPEAIIYLCDKMVGASVYAERTSDIMDKKAYKSIAYKLMRNLVEERDQPVAEGFKTTFKQIINVVQSLMYQAVDPKEKDSEKPNTSAIPPIWVVMPNVSMMDNKTFAVPGAIPTLPFPTSMLPSLSTQSTAFPSAAEDLKKQLEMLKERRKATQKESDAKIFAEKEKAAKQLAAKELDTKGIDGKGHEVEDKEKADEDEDDDSEDDEDYEDDEDDEDNEEFDVNYEDDRFADADTSDECKEDKEQISTKTSINESPTQVEHTVEVIKSNSQASNSQVSEGSEVVKANSSWLNFAAASPKDEAKSGPTSPRDNNRGNKPYHSIPRY